MNDVPLRDTSDAKPFEVVRPFRLDRGETLLEFGAHIGLSAGKVSELERGVMAPSPKIALAIERLSDGRIDAASLNDIVSQSREAITKGAAQDWDLPDTPEDRPAAAHAEVVICDVCDDRVDQQRVCTFVDCPQIARHAA